MHNRDGSRTQIYTKIIRGEFDAACNELPRWVYGGGQAIKRISDTQRKRTCPVLCEQLSG
jgi:hypothetical protein